MKLSTNSQFKRPLSDTNTLKSPNSPTASNNKMPFIQPDKKKPKMYSKSNLLTFLLKPAVTFKFFLENFGNYNINIK